jgi:hypothetical protein
MGGYWAETATAKSRGMPAYAGLLQLTAGTPSLPTALNS